jgi:urease accessory protein
MNKLDTAIRSDDNPATQAGWCASLELSFTKKHKTILSHIKHQGPLRIQRTFYPENNGTCHAYLLHPPGGIVGGDQLNINIRAHSQTDTLITTPGANKFYRSNQLYAHQNQHIIVEKNATFEWFPQETIVFDSAYVKSKTRIDLQENARFIGWDIVCLGRPAAGESFVKGHFNQHIEIWRDQQAVLIDRCHFNGDDEALHALWGMANYPVNGIMIATNFNRQLVDEIRESVSSNDCQFSVTNINDLIVCRYLGHHASEARSLFTRAWKILRPAITEKAAVIPRIWNT